MKKLLILSGTLLVSLFITTGLIGCDGAQAPDGELDLIAPEPDLETVDDVVGIDPCVDVECKSGAVCVEGICEPEVANGYGCANPFDLGVLSGEKTHRFTANPQGQPNLLNTSCSIDDHSAQGIFRFQVEEPTKIDSRITSSAHVLVQELRVGSCTSPGAISWCSINERHWTALPGEDYFLIVEARQGDPGEDSAGVGESGLISEFEFEIKTLPYACFPAGERACAGDSVEVCAGGDEIRSLGCAAGCKGGECLGDSCQNPIEVNGSLNLQADLASFQHTMNFNNSPSCTSSGTTGSGTSTLGQDLVFYLPGLTGGQTVEVDAPGSSFVIGVMDQCNRSAPTCLVGDDLTGSLSWEVERGGDYYVVANRFLPSSSSGEFRINVID